jgi:hypothetical protein
LFASAFSSRSFSFYIRCILRLLSLCCSFLLLLFIRCSFFSLLFDTVRFCLSSFHSHSLFVFIHSFLLVWCILSLFSHSNRRLMHSLRLLHLRYIHCGTFRRCCIFDSSFISFSFVPYQLAIILCISMKLVFSLGMTSGRDGARRSHVVRLVRAYVGLAVTSAGTARVFGCAARRREMRRRALALSAVARVVSLSAVSILSICTFVLTTLFRRYSADDLHSCWYFVMVFHCDLILPVFHFCIRHSTVPFLLMPCCCILLGIVVHWWYCFIHSYIVTYFLLIATLLNRLFYSVIWSLLMSIL